MNQDSEFPFDRTRRVTLEENQKFRTAISEQFGLNLKQWDRLVSDADAAALKAEFAQEDTIFAEIILPEYSSNLQQEDYA
jgi:hypothetical protein